MVRWLLSSLVAGCVAVSGIQANVDACPRPSAAAASAARPGVQATRVESSADTTRVVYLPTDSPESRNPSHRWEVQSSVQVSREALREAYVASREAYTQKLQKFAKCTPEKARNAVQAAHPGMRIDDVQLRNIRSNLVYMAVVEDEEDRYLVIVDAGNGKVLLDRPLPTHHERVFADKG